MNILFYGTVAVLRFIAYLTGHTYEEVNIWGYCIIGPVIFYLLYMLLGSLLCYKAFRWKSTPIIRMATIAFLIFGLYTISRFPSIRHMASHIYPIYDNCVAYMYKIGGEHSTGAYISANVWTLVIIGPLLFLLLTGATMVNIHTIKKKIKTWQVYAGITILFISSIAMQYGINILKVLV